MELYIVYGLQIFDGSDGLEPLTLYSLYGVFNDQNKANEIWAEKAKMNEQNGIKEFIGIRVTTLNKPTDEWHEDC